MFLKLFSLIFVIYSCSYITTVAAQSNKKCPPLILTPGETTPKLGAETKTADRIEMPVICAEKNNKEVYMFFNGNIGGPSHPKNEPITATLHCIDGQWKYTEHGVSIIITEVSCISV